MSTTGRLTSAVAVALFATMVGSSAFGQVQSKDQQKCINTLNKDICKVAATQGKDNSGCVKTGTKGAVSPTCVTQDGSGKVAAPITKAGGDETKNACLGANAPNFGYSAAGSGTNSTNATGAAGAALTAEVNLTSDTYGSSDLSGAILTAKADGKCQSAVTKDLEKVMATKWKEYVKCKKTALKAGATSAAALEGCVTGLPADSKVTGTVTKLNSDIGKDCGAPVSIAVDFNGGCSGSTTGTLGACLDKKAECRICLALNAIDNLTVNCDLFDDGLVNGSCGGCPLAAGRYTQTTTGGSLHVATFAPFAFPAGGTTIQDVGAASPPACVHDTVVPFPGGLTTPNFCVPALGATTSVTQSGCGVGRIDSNGGSDFTVTELGDTSESTCAATQGTCPGAGPAPDSSGRIDITVGGNGPDTCASGGTANAIVSIPVSTLTWVAADSSCPDVDGTYNPGTDTLLASFPQTLDLTTDTNTAQFADLGTMDGCKKSGLGPVGPYASTGQCIDIGAMTVNVAASGTVFSSGGPTYDLLFTTVQNATIAPPGPNLGATCGSPPVINFTGTATRCLNAP